MKVWCVYVFVEKAFQNSAFISPYNFEENSVIIRNFFKDTYRMIHYPRQLVAKIREIVEGSTGFRPM
jgi:hypothetical protein